jgi:hypothetical protein
MKLSLPFSLAHRLERIINVLDRPVDLPQILIQPGNLLLKLVNLSEHFCPGPLQACSLGEQCITRLLQVVVDKRVSGGFVRPCDKQQRNHRNAYQHSIHPHGNIPRIRRRYAATQELATRQLYWDFALMANK